MKTLEMLRMLLRKDLLPLEEYQLVVLVFNLINNMDLYSSWIILHKQVHTCLRELTPERLTIDPKNARTQGNSFLRRLGQPLRLSATLPLEEPDKALLGRGGYSGG